MFDCLQAVVFCNQAFFVILQVIDGGNDFSEVDDVVCLNIVGMLVEIFFIWFVWIVVELGSLIFVFMLINEIDDFDFVFYEFLNGLGDCFGKIVFCCMVFFCIGFIGLNDIVFDIFEVLGCGLGDDNFLVVVQMEEGVIYGLMVNNFL